MGTDHACIFDVSLDGAIMGMMGSGTSPSGSPAVSATSVVTYVQGPVRLQ